jgi:RNA polymerase sigma-70 factor (ECF subfamily)
VGPPAATFDDSALIQRALAGQSECFEVLINRHLPAVRARVCLMAPNAADVEDILQEILLKVWRHLSTFQSQSSFRTWITRVAINEVLQSYRRRQRRPICHTFGDFDTLASSIESPLQALVRSEMTRDVRNAIVELPARYKEVLTLRSFEELSVREIAQSVHLSVPVVKTRLFRARMTLKRSSIRNWAPDGRNRRARLSRRPRTMLIRAVSNAARRGRREA